MKTIAMLLVLCLSLESAFGVIIILKNNRVITGEVSCNKQTFVYVEKPEKFFQIQKSIIKTVYKNDKDITLSFLAKNDTIPINTKNKEIEVLIVENTISDVSDRDFQLKLLKEQQKGQEKLMDKATSPMKTYLSVSLIIALISIIVYSRSAKK